MMFMITKKESLDNDDGWELGQWVLHGFRDKSGESKGR